MNVDERVAIVTGAGQGIGLEICRKLSARGVKIILNDLDEAMANSATNELRSAGGVCIPIVGDSSNIDVIRLMINAAVTNFGKLNIAIANAGITLFGDFYNYTEESFNRVMQVNLNGTFFLAQQAAIQMKKQGKGGSILFTSSVTAHQAHKNLAAYSMSKAALEMLAKNLVIELSPFKITINTIAPGATLTERTLTDQGYEQTWAQLTPLGRPANVKDIAHAAVFLVSEEASHITGQSLVIDGGWTSVSPSP